MQREGGREGPQTHCPSNLIFHAPLNFLAICHQHKVVHVWPILISGLYTDNSHSAVLHVPEERWKQRREEKKYNKNEVPRSTTSQSMCKEVKLPLIRFSRFFLLFLLAVSTSSELENQPSIQKWETEFYWLTEFRLQEKFGDQKVHARSTLIASLGNWRPVCPQLTVSKGAVWSGSCLATADGSLSEKWEALSSFFNFYIPLSTWKIINSVGLELLIEVFVRIDTSVPSGMRTLSTSTYLFGVSGEDSSDGLYNFSI